MEWSAFINKIYDELQRGEAFDDFRHPIENEQDLTEITALGIRKIMAEFYGLSKNSETFIKNVTFRKGPTEKDKKAYSKAKKDRWVFFHNVFFAPDIMIQDPVSLQKFLPIEVKLLKGKNQSPSQSIATAIGQSLIYTTKHSHTIVLLGILRSAEWGRYKFRDEPNKIETSFYNELNAMNIKVLIRKVGLNSKIRA